MATRSIMLDNPFFDQKRDFNTFLVNSVSKNHDSLMKFVATKKNYNMKNKLTKLEKFQNIDTHLINIITMNDSDKSAKDDEELMDFDFDYDPNEMYFALLKSD
jgi:hypothetical protein